MDYTAEQLDSVRAFNLKATAGEIGSTVMELPFQIVHETNAPAPFVASEDPQDQRAVQELVAETIANLLAYVEDAGVEPAAFTRSVAEAFDYTGLDHKWELKFDQHVTPADAPRTADS